MVTKLENCDKRENGDKTGTWQLNRNMLKQKWKLVTKLEDEIGKTTKTFSLNNKKQQINIIDTIKAVCKKYSKEKTGKKPITNVNLVRI